MAKIKFGSVITDSRGSIGGHTFKWGRFGNVLQHKVTPVRRDTPRKSKINALFSQLSKQWWNELDPTQRDEWRALAAANPRPNVWGDEYPLTGISFFVLTNMRLAQANAAGLLDAPADQAVTSPATLAITATAPGTWGITFTPSPVPADHLGYLFATPAISPGITNASGVFAWLSESGSGETSPWTLSSEFTSRFGVVTTGRYFGAKLAFLNTTNGALSPYLYAATLGA